MKFLETKTISPNSPKNKFIADLFFSKPIYTGGGHTKMVGMMEKDENNEHLQRVIRDAKKVGAKVTIVWRMNTLEFPKFNWVKL